MRHVLITLLFTIAVAGCGDPPEGDIAVLPDVTWTPFEQGELSLGLLGQARFQAAACAYPDVVPLMPSCAFEMPLITGHRTALYVELPEGTLGADVRSSNGQVVVVDGVYPAPRAGMLRVELSAPAPGDAELVLDGADGMIDALPLKVRRAASLRLEVQGGERLSDASLQVGVGETVRVFAVPLSADGAPLNAYEVDWELAGPLDVTSSVDRFSTWISDVDGMSVGATTLRASVPVARFDLSLSVVE